MNRAKFEVNLIFPPSIEGSRVKYQVELGKCSMHLSV